MTPKTKNRLNTHFEPYPHDHPRAETKEDGSEVHKFRFPIPRGILSPRMSTLEIRSFIINHMRGILGMGLLADLRPDIQAEFHIIYRRLMFTPSERLDELQPWIRIEYHERDDDAIFINLNEKRPQLAGPSYFT